LPFYVGDVFGRMSENRRSVLEMSQKYLNEFLKLIDHYDLLDKDVDKKTIFSFFLNIFFLIDKKPMEKIE